MWLGAVRKAFGGSMSVRSGAVRASGEVVLVS